MPQNGDRRGGRRLDPTLHPAWPAWIDLVRDRIAVHRPDERDGARRGVEAALLRVIAAEAGWDPTDHDLRLLDHEDEPDLASPPRGLLGPDLLGAVHEALIDPASRRTTGAHYTPAPLASSLVSWALERWEPPSGATPLVVDLAVGGGAFLLAAARWARTCGNAVTDVLAGLGGVDLDPGAVAVAEASLVAWGRAKGWDGTGPGPTLAVADGTDVEALGPSSGLSMGQVDLVVGNPPFLGQLGRGTARDRATAARLRARYGTEVGGYVDAAAVFLRVACEWARPGGRVVLIQPESVLGSRDAEGVRTAVGDRADLVGLWVAGEAAFAAAVDVCAPVLELRGSASVGDGTVGADDGAMGELPADPGEAEPIGGRPPASAVGGLEARDAGDAETAGRARGGCDAGGQLRGGGLATEAGHRGSEPGSQRANREHVPIEPRLLNVGGAGAELADVVPSGLQRSVARADGVAVEARPATTVPPGTSWAALLAEARGVPVVDLDRGAGELGDLATATAGFRQHFYALAPHLSELPVGGACEPAPVTGRLVPVLTTGLVDPLCLLWGTRPARIAGSSWHRPVVDLGAVAIDDPTVAAWVRDRLRPKVVVAPQTRVVEAAVDAAGRFVPGVPLVSVEPLEPAADPEPDLWLLAAALSAPPVAAWALALAAGTGRNRDALRLSARLVRTVPLPTDRSAWEAAAARLRAGHPLVEVGPDLTAAYGLDPEHPVTNWWRVRLPGPRR